MAGKGASPHSIPRSRELGRVAPPGEERNFRQMTELPFADEILDRLRERNPRFHGHAYLFLLSALNAVMGELEEPRHISGEELAHGVRDLALAEYGPLARTVLAHWGIHSTEDMGEIVFTLVECGLLVKREEDRREDFQNLFDFEEVFDLRYPWGGRFEPRAT